MGSLSDSATSLTLLGFLGGPDKDEAAWCIFYNRYQPMIQRWCLRQRLQAADVEDVTQKVLGRIFKSIHTYDPARGGFRAWLKTMVNNAVKDFLRGRARRPGDHGSGDSNVAELLQAVAQPETVDGLVRELDSSLRRVVGEILARVENEVEPDTMLAFRWTVLEGQSLADVAAKLGKSYAAVCMAIHRVKKKLRAASAQIQE